MTIAFYIEVKKVKATQKYSAWVHVRKGNENFAAHAGSFETEELANLAAEGLEHSLKRVAEMATKETDQ